MQTKKFVEVDKLLEMKQKGELDLFDTYDLEEILERAPAAEVVSKVNHERIKTERDKALRLLVAHGICVVREVRCK